MESFNEKIMNGKDSENIQSMAENIMNGKYPENRQYIGEMIMNGKVGENIQSMTEKIMNGKYHENRQYNGEKIMNGKDSGNIQSIGEKIMNGKVNEKLEYGTIFPEVNGTVDKPIETNSSASQWIKLAVLSFGNFCVGACVSLPGPFFPAEAESKGVSSTEYGFIFGVLPLIIFFTAPIMGKLVVYISPKNLLIFGTVTVGTSGILFGTLNLVNDTTAFVALAFTIRIVEGVGSASLRTATFTILASQFQERLGKSLAVVQTSLGLGLIMGSTVGGALHDAGGYGMPFFVMGSLILINAITIFFSFPKVEPSKIQEKGNFMKFLLHPTTLIFSLINFSSYNYMGINQATLEPHIRQFHLSGLMIGFIFSLGGIVFVCVAPGFGCVIDKKFCDNQCLCLLGCLFAVASVLLLGPTPFLPLNPDLSYTIIALVFYGISHAAKLNSSFTGLVESASNRGFPSDLSTFGLVSSTVASAQSLGAFTGPSIGGILLDKYGYRNSTLFQLFLEMILVIFLVISIASGKMCGTKAQFSFSEDGNYSSKTDLIITEKCVEHCKKKKEHCSNGRNFH